MYTRNITFITNDYNLLTFSCGTNVCFCSTSVKAMLWLCATWRNSRIPALIFLHFWHKATVLDILNKIYSNISFQTKLYDIKSINATYFCIRITVWYVLQSLLHVLQNSDLRLVDYYFFFLKLILLRFFNNTIKYLTTYFTIFTLVQLYPTQ